MEHSEGTSSEHESESGSEELIGEDLTTETDPRLDVTLLGVKLGTANGWDDGSDQQICFYDFQPEEEFVNLPKDCPLWIDTNKGSLYVFESAVANCDVEPVWKMEHEEVINMLYEHFNKDFTLLDFCRQCGVLCKPGQGLDPAPTCVECGAYIKSSTTRLKGVFPKEDAQRLNRIMEYHELPEKDPKITS